MILIASFPRSGNHLVRFFVEYVTGQSTLGCMGNAKDVPIFKSFDGPDLSHVEDRAVARKAHFAREIRRNQKRETYDGMIFIRRQMVAAIGSHVRGVSGSRKLRIIIKSTIRYLHLWAMYAFWAGPKILISYERLVSDDGAMEAERIAAFLGNRANKARSADAIHRFKEMRSVYATSAQAAWKRPFKSDVSVSAEHQDHDVLRV